MAPVLFGDWLAMHVWLNSLEKAPLEPFAEGLESLGKSLQSKIRQHILDQDLDWAPLSHSTISQKGFDTILMNTQEYMQKIEYEIYKGKANEWELIVYPKGSHSASGLPMQTLGSYLEYGTTRMPARPLWRPVFSEMENMREFKDLVSKATR